MSKEFKHPVLDTLRYPESEARATTENWHGITIQDNFSWLAENSPEVRDWDDKQNELTRTYLDSLEYRTEIRDGLKKWFDLDQIGCPFPRGEKIFQWKRKAGENHYVLYSGKDIDNQNIVLDPNKLSEDGTTSVGWTSISKDGKYIAYGISSEGNERSILKVRDIETGLDLDDEIPDCFYSGSVAWLPDNSGFYYARHPKIGTVPNGEENLHRKIYFHSIGNKHDDDLLIFEPKDPIHDWTSISVSKDGKWKTITVSHGASNDVYISKADTPDFKPFAVGEDNHFYVSEFDGNFYIMTDHNAPKFKVMKVSSDVEDFSDKTKWEEFIPEQDDTLDSFSIVGGKAILEYQVKACSKLEIMDLYSLDRFKVELPTLGTVTSVTGTDDKPDLYFSFESCAVPDSIYRLNIDTRKQEKIDGLKVDADLTQITTEQVTYNSKDGTPVTMFVVKNKNCVNDGGNKTILYGYGGFSSSENPAFSGSIVEWVNSGGIYVATNLRGGSEYGEDWHRAGMLENKQNVFDDFIAAAEYLVDNNYTKPEKLAIWGGSNGGLLVGAVMVQRPELFGAVVCTVPLLDMIHYDQLKIAKLWRSEYGDPSNPEHFKFLYAYSPYHRVVEGTNYPSVFLRTAENDSRVDAMHARKMAARLQNSTISDRPILLCVEDKAGHGAGKPVSKIIEDTTDIYTFLRATIGN